MHLAQLLLSSSWQAEQNFRQQQSNVREKLIKLYRKVLELEMNCVCATASAWNTAAKNVVGWNTLDKLVNILVELDEQVVDIIKQHCAEKTREILLPRYLDLDITSPRGSESMDSITSHPLQMTQIAG